MNSDASVVRASDGRAMPKVNPPLLKVSETVQVSKVIPVSGSVYATGVPLWATDVDKTGWN